MKKIKPKAAELAAYNEVLKAQLDAMTKKALIEHMVTYEARIKKEFAEARADVTKADNLRWEDLAKHKAQLDALGADKGVAALEAAELEKTQLQDAIDQLKKDVQALDADLEAANAKVEDLKAKVPHLPICAGYGETNPGLITCTCGVL